MKQRGQQRVQTGWGRWQQWRWQNEANRKYRIEHNRMYNTGSGCRRCPRAASSSRRSRSGGSSDGRGSRDISDERGSSRGSNGKGAPATMEAVEAALEAVQWWRRAATEEAAAEKAALEAAKVEKRAVVIELEAPGGSGSCSGTK